MFHELYPKYLTGLIWLMDMVCWHGTLLFSDANGVLEFFFPGDGHFIFTFDVLK